MSSRLVQLGNTYGLVLTALSFRVFRINYGWLYYGNTNVVCNVCDNLSIMTYSTTGRLFSGKSSSDFFDERRSSIISKINSVQQNELLNMSVEQYIEYLFSHYELDYPTIDSTSPRISSYEADISGTRFPMEFGILDRNKMFKRDIIVFHIAFDGDISLLHYQPSSFYLSGVPAVTIRNTEFLFEYINFYNDSDRIKREFQSDLGSFLNCYNSLASDFRDYNNSLKDFIRKEITNRREALLRKNNFLSSFEIPFKEKENISQTFNIPPPKLRDRISITRPTASNSTFIPEPTLDYSNYQKILKIIDDAGKNFERYPSLYKQKSEEDLRDHILFLLDPQFESGSASAETFNKSGKTDILLRYDSSVVFVGECKFWSGEKGYYQTIDQLLGYLTWRDSKTAVIIFVKNKEIVPVLKKIDEVSSLHSTYLSTKGKRAENWWEHIFHIPNDKNKEVIVSILLFHIPDF